MSYKKSNSIKSIWSNIEKPVIYITIGAFISFQLLKLFLPNENIFFKKDEIPLVFIAFIILLIFRHIENKLDNQKEIFLIREFNSDLRNALGKKHFKHVDIIGLSGYFYFQAIREGKLKIDELRLLLRKPDLSSVLYPDSIIEKEKFAPLAEAGIENFKSLLNDGYIKSLEIKYYDFDNLVHFMILDKEIVHFGWLKPIENLPGSEVLASYVIRNKSETGSQLINDLSDVFKTIYDKYSISKYENHS